LPRRLEMAELKEIETTNERRLVFGDVSSRDYLPSESNHASWIPIFALHGASIGPRRTDLCAGDI
jgi:hypothetical protein